MVLPTFFIAMNRKELEITVKRLVFFGAPKVSWYLGRDQWQNVEIGTSMKPLQCLWDGIPWFIFLRGAAVELPHLSAAWGFHHPGDGHGFYGYRPPRSANWSARVVCRTCPLGKTCKISWDSSPCSWHHFWWLIKWLQKELNGFERASWFSVSRLNNRNKTMNKLSFQKVALFRLLLIQGLSCYRYSMDDLITCCALWGSSAAAGWVWILEPVRGISFWQRWATNHVLQFDLRTWWLAGRGWEKIQY